MDRLRDYRTNSTQVQRGTIWLPIDNESAETPVRRTPKNKDTKRRSFSLATIAVALALLPLSIHGLAGAQDDGSMNSNSVQVPAAEQTTQTDLAPAAIATCLPDETARIRVSRTTDEVETDPSRLPAKGSRPKTNFAPGTPPHRPVRGRWSVRTRCGLLQESARPGHSASLATALKCLKS